MLRSAGRFAKLRRRNYRAAATTWLVKMAIPMLQILESATNVGTPIAFLGLVVALLYFTYTRRLKHSETMLELLPEDARAQAADEYLSRYGIDGKDLPGSDKLALIKDESDKRHRKSTLILILAAIVFVVCFAIASVAFILDPPSEIVELDEDTKALIATLDERAKEIRGTLDKRREMYQQMIEDGKDHQENLDRIEQVSSRFEAMHREYIESIKNKKVELMHERYSKLRDFLTDDKLMKFLGVMYSFNYRTRPNVDGTVKKFRTWDPPKADSKPKEQTSAYFDAALTVPITNS